MYDCSKILHSCILLSEAFQMPKKKVKAPKSSRHESAQTALALYQSTLDSKMPPVDDSAQSFVYFDKLHANRGIRHAKPVPKYLITTREDLKDIWHKRALDIISSSQQKYNDSNYVSKESNNVKESFTSQKDPNDYDLWNLDKSEIGLDFVHDRIELYNFKSARLFGDDETNKEELSQLDIALNSLLENQQEQ
ncbi:MAG: hypothetical protein MHMPM18_002497 [Marteilia pararefringens]